MLNLLLGFIVTSVLLTVLCFSVPLPKWIGDLTVFVIVSTLLLALIYLVYGG